MWIPHTAPDVISAQAPKPIMITRFYTGPDGQTHAEEVPLKLTDSLTDMFKATGVQFTRRAPGITGDWHTAPRRQFVITLSGKAEVEVAGGQKVESGPGHIDLVEDTTGKGHITRLLGPDDRVAVIIPLADQPGDQEARRGRVR